ncbi:DUF2897 family protein [Alishewanella jeotgali]|uniref:DUF2897 domain-containing protein n=1 Tax=Alishewanella jeotgali KCTC 22429 TaxID=1129374 RepID=H3ZJH7_9ALTE|nr:DUF2897 family protein [Alishewanella jeotgali]EHR39278.1 hypothetical protein AJE_17725 [Alishewanella jeotgali KCTC 22429]
MNWPLFWALLLAFGFIIGNVLLVKHSAKMKMPALKPLPEALPKQPTAADTTAATADSATSASAPAVSATTAQKPNSPEENAAADRAD